MSKSLNKLLEGLASLEDPRQSWKVLYPLEEILLIALSATASGADDFVEMVEWAEMHQGFLRRFYPYTQGIPSHDTLNDVMNALDTGLFESLFVEWVNTLSAGEADLLSIDGKTSRRSGSTKQKPLHLVSAWAGEQNVVLGQEATDEKSNEITAIPALLKRLDIHGSLITIDAMGTQKNIARQILAGKGDYLLAVKGNQGTLYEDVQTFFKQPPKGDVIDSHTTVEKGHGRIEQRDCRICTDVDWLKQRHGWEGLAAIVEVSLTTEKKGASTTYRRYYICSLAMTAKAALYAVRSHWGIENQLHWVLEVVFKEDHARVRSGNGAKNMAIVRHIITNLLRQMQGKTSLKVKRKKAAWSVNFLEKLLQQ